MQLIWYIAFIPGPCHDKTWLRAYTYCACPAFILCMHNIAVSLKSRSLHTHSSLRTNFALRCKVCSEWTVCILSELCVLKTECMNMLRLCMSETRVFCDIAHSCLCLIRYVCCAQNMTACLLTNIFIWLKERAVFVKNVHLKWKVLMKPTFWRRIAQNRSENKKVTEFWVFQNCFGWHHHFEYLMRLYDVTVIVP